MIRKYKSVYTGAGKWTVTDKDTMPEIIAGGVTQNGKTMIKAVGIWVAFRLGAGHADAPKIATILVSTTRNGSWSLYTKLEKAFKMLPANVRPPILFAADALYTKHERRVNLRESIAQGGCIVVNDTALRINEAVSAIFEARGSRQWKFDRPTVQLFLDEADSFYCNKDKPIKLEKAVHDYLPTNAQPILRMQVYVTLIPIFFHLRDKQQGVDTDSIGYSQMIRLLSWGTFR